MKQSVTIQEGWISIADSLSDEQRGQFYHAICHYALDGVIPDLPELLAAIFDLIRPAIDLSAKRKAAQRKGARIRRKNAADLQTNLQNGLQNVDNGLQNGLQNADTCETVSNISTQPTTEPPQITHENNCLQNELQTGLQNEVKEKKESLQESLQPVKEKKKSSPPDPPLKETKERVTKTPAYPYAQMLPEPYREKWIQWEQHRKQIRKTLTPTSAAQQIKLLLQYDPKTAGEIIDTSIRNGYQGLFPPKYQPQQPNRKDNSGI